MFERGSRWESILERNRPRITVAASKGHASFETAFPTGPDKDWSITESNR